MPFFRHPAPANLQKACTRLCSCKSEGFALRFKKYQPPHFLPKHTGSGDCDANFALPFSDEVDFSCTIACLVATPPLEVQLTRTLVNDLTVAQPYSRTTTISESFRRCRTCAARLDAVNGPSTTRYEKAKGFPSALLHTSIVNVADSALGSEADRHRLSRLVGITALIASLLTSSKDSTSSGRVGRTAQVRWSVPG